MPKLVFIVGRTTFFKLLGPIIDAGLKRGWEVECWLPDVRLKEKLGDKGHLLPTMGNIPRFQNGQPTLRTFLDKEEFADLAREGGEGVMLSIYPAWRYMDTPLPGWRFVMIQTGLDSFYHFNQSDLQQCDLICLYAPYWARWGAGFLALRGECGPHGFPEDVQRKIVYVGHPEFDALGLIDPVEVRARWGIPPDQPVISYFYFDLLREDNPGARIMAHEGFPGRLGRLLREGAQYGAKAVAPFAAWPFRGVSQEALLKAIRAFADKNGAYLLLKTRYKELPNPALSALVDQVLVDKGFYPSTSLEVEAISRVGLHHFSTAALELAAADTFSLGLWRTHRDLGRDVPVPWVDRFNIETPLPEGYRPWYDTEPESAYHFSGVNRLLDLPEAIHGMGELSLEALTLDETARSRYLETFAGPVDGQAGQRVITAIETAFS